MDVNSDTVEDLIAGADVVLDGADNFEVRYSNVLQEILNSNVAGGKTKRQSGREIDISAKIIVDSTDEDFAHTELVRASGTVPDFEFTVGDAGIETAPALAYTIWGRGEVRELEPDLAGDSLAHTQEIAAVWTVDAGEFVLRFV